MTLFYYPFKMPQQGLYSGPKGFFVQQSVKQKAERWMAVQTPKPTQPMTRHHLKVIRFYQGAKERYYDEGTIQGGLRPVIDAIVDGGWLRDDNPLYLSQSTFPIIQVKNHKTIRNGFILILVPESEYNGVSNWEDSNWIRYACDNSPQWSRTAHDSPDGREDTVTLERATQVLVGTKSTHSAPYSSSTLGHPRKAS